MVDTPRQKVAGMPQIKEPHSTRLTVTLHSFSSTVHTYAKTTKQMSSLE